MRSMKRLAGTRTLIPGLILAASVLGVAWAPTRANADTIAVFSWVELPGTPAGSGTLTLDLPATITTATFNDTADGAATASEIKSLTYTFSSGQSVSLSNFT